MKLFLECDNDETLAKCLGIKANEIEHCKGRTRVCSKLSKKRNVKGLVDENPGTALTTYLSKLSIIENKHNIIYCLDKNLNNRVIILQPDIEGWLSNVCKKEKIKLNQYGLPDNLKELPQIIKLRRNKFETLVKSMQTKKIEGIIYLKKLLNK